MYHIWMQWESKGIINRSICKNYEVPSILGTLSQIKLFVKNHLGEAMYAEFKVQVAEANSYRF